MPEKDGKRTWVVVNRAPVVAEVLGKVVNSGTRLTRLTSFSEIGDKGEGAPSSDHIFDRALGRERGFSTGWLGWVTGIPGKEWLILE